jgi:hypothetical protein
LADEIFTYLAPGESNFVIKMLGVCLWFFGRQNKPNACRVNVNERVKKLLVEVYGKFVLSVQELVEQKLPVSKLLSFDENLFYLFSGDNVYK